MIQVKKDVSIVIVPQNNEQIGSYLCPTYSPTFEIAGQKWIAIRKLYARKDLSYVTSSLLTDPDVIRELLRNSGRDFVQSFVYPRVAMFRFNGFGQLEMMFSKPSGKKKFLPKAECPKLPPYDEGSCTGIATANGLLRLCKAEKSIHGGISDSLIVDDFTYKWVSLQSGDHDMIALFNGASGDRLNDFLRRNGLHAESGHGKGLNSLVAVLAGTRAFIESPLFPDNLRKSTKASLRGCELIDQSTINGKFPQKYLTKYIIVQEDTLTSAMIHMDKDPTAEVMVVNFANNISPGGGYKHGCTAQEEDLFRRSTLPYTIGQRKEDLYPINTTAAGGSFPRNVRALFTPYCNILRQNSQNLFQFNSLTAMAHYSVSVCSLAAFDCTKEQEAFRGVDSNTGKCLLNPHGYQHTKNRIRMMFQMAIHKKCDTLIVGAFGCGAFNNSPTEIIEIFNTVLKEFDGCLMNVIFAIIGDNFKIFNAGIIFP